MMRLSKIALLFMVALLASFAAVGNMMDFNINTIFYGHMFSENHFLPRSATEGLSWSMILHELMYLLIIVLQMISALLCWLGAIYSAKAFRSSLSEFHQMKKFGIFGLSVGIIAWLFAATLLANNWLSAILSTNLNGLTDAFHFTVVLFFMLIYLVIPEFERAE